MSRNFLFLRSIFASLLTKLFGLLVVFISLPLAAISLNTNDYATFNYSMAITGLLGIVTGPVSSALVVRFAHTSDADNHRQIAEESLATFMTLGVVLAPPAISAAYFLSPYEHRAAIALAAVAVVATNICSWAEIYRIGVREDHISSAFALGNNITIISGVYLLSRSDGLSFGNMLLVYYSSPLLWNVLSLVYLLRSKALRVHWVGEIDRLKAVLIEALPLFGQTASEYVRLYFSSMLAFYVVSTSSYAVFSTLVLFVARLTNPFSLVARPLVPAYVDAIKRSDFRWLRTLNQLIVGVLAIAALSIAAVGVAAIAFSFEEIHIGAIAIRPDTIGHYLVLSGLMFWSSVISMALGSLYLALRRASEFSNVTLFANVLAVSVGTLLAFEFDAIALFASIAITNSISVVFLLRRFLKGSPPARAVIQGEAESQPIVPVEF